MRRPQIETASRRRSRALGRFGSVQLVLGGIETGWLGANVDKRMMAHGLQRLSLVGDLGVGRLSIQTSNTKVVGPYSELRIAR